MTTQLGCFGSILFRDRNPSGRCSNCAEAGNCDNHIQETREKIYEHAQALAPLKTKKGQKLKEFLDKKLEPPTEADNNAQKYSQVTRHDLNKKPLEFYQKWIASNIDFQSITRGENPFINSKSTFARVCTSWLLEVKTPTKSAMRAYLERVLNWSFGTANSHVNIYCEVMQYAGVLILDNDQIHIRGNK